MSRLYRPHVPLKVRIAVVVRQLLTKIPITANVTLALPFPTPNPLPGESDGQCLDRLLNCLVARLECERSDLRLDHDPPLGARKRRGSGKRTRYSPSANDPTHLFYRPHGPEFAGSHLIKTNTRGDHGQYPDRVLIKRERKRREKQQKKTCTRCRRNYRIGARLCGRCLKVALKHRRKIVSRGFSKQSRPMGRRRLQWLR